MSASIRPHRQNAARRIRNHIRIAAVADAAAAARSSIDFVSGNLTRSPLLFPTPVRSPQSPPPLPQSNILCAGFWGARWEGRRTPSQTHRQTARRCPSSARVRIVKPCRACANIKRVHAHLTSTTASTRSALASFWLKHTKPKKSMHHKYDKSVCLA